MPGTPIRLYLRDQAQDNPFKDRKKSIPSRLKKHVDAKKKADHKETARKRRESKKPD